ncbi:hypothetical protein HDU97_007061 [Phlyctochytrium planicorne]|nr:hypothetical protein HDU97_007061 [Phlyctochytrium planicorne]
MQTEDKILHTLAGHHEQVPSMGDDDQDLYGEVDEIDMDESEEIVEDISESELLSAMDQMEDSLLVARRLFKLEGLQVTAVPKIQDIIIPMPEDPSPPFSSLELDVLPAAAVEALWRQGFTFIDGLLDADLAREARDRGIQMGNDGLLTPASEVRMDDDPFRDRTARDDIIAWLHPDDPLHPALATVVNLLKSIQKDLSVAMHIQGDSEIQLALYRGNGGRYERHRDAFPNDLPEDTEQRRVTCIVYLTTERAAAAADGSLRIFRPLDKPEGLEIAAVPGRVVLFLSGVVDHEVQPVRLDERVAVTTWIR